MPRPRTIALSLVLAALAAAAVTVPRLSTPELHGTDLGPSAPAHDFTLQAADRGAVSLSDFRGRVVLLFFGYTSCPDVCPLTMARLASVVERLGERGEDVQVLLISVDPAVDTLDRLRDYVRRFDTTFLGLGGDRAALAETARAFGAYAGEPQTGVPTAEPGSGEATGDSPAAAGRGHDDHAPEAVAGAPTDAPRIIPHTAHVFGIDRAGRFRVLWGPDLTAAQIAEDVRALLAR